MAVESWRVEQRIYEMLALKRCQNWPRGGESELVRVGPAELDGRGYNSHRQSCLVSLINESSLRERLIKTLDVLQQLREGISKLYI